MTVRQRLPAALIAIFVTACGTATTTSTPTGDAIPTEGPTSNAATATQSPSPSPSPTPVPGSGEQVAAFGAEGEIESVLDVADTPFGVIAVGEHYQGTALQVFGSLPNEARIWRSDEGAAWEDITPDSLKAASLHQVVALPDGSVVAFGSRAGDDGGGMPMEVPGSWLTRDGRNWAPAKLNINGEPILDIISGGRGHLAVVGTALGHRTIWYAPELWDFEKVLGGASDTGWGSVAAGTEGFVAVRHVANTDVTSLLSASGNGVDWFDAESAPTDVRHVAPSGSDWVAIGPGSFEDRTEDSTTTSWFSANGLDWMGVGELDLDAVDIGGGDACKEYVTHLISAGGVLVASTVLSYPCSEGGVVRYGRSSLSMDRGSSWDELTFLRSGQDPDSRGRGRGATVNAAIPVEDGILLVGERDYQAAFWMLAAQ